MQPTNGERRRLARILGAACPVEAKLHTERCHQYVSIVPMYTSKEVSFTCSEDPHCPYHAFTRFYCQDEGNYLFTFTLQHSKVDYFPYIVAGITLVVGKSMPLNLKLWSFD